MMPIDYSKYPPNWKELRKEVLKRADHKCECCGLPNHCDVWSIKLDVREGRRYKSRSIWFRNKNDAIREHHSAHPPKKVKVILTIAHLDHDETNWDVNPDRLKAMCQLCHLRYDAKEKFRRINKPTPEPC